MRRIEKEEKDFKLIICRLQETQLQAIQSPLRRIQWSEKIHRPQEGHQSNDKKTSRNPKIHVELQAYQPPRSLRQPKKQPTTWQLCPLWSHLREWASWGTQKGDQRGFLDLRDFLKDCSQGVCEVSSSHSKETGVDNEDDREVWGKAWWEELI